MKKLNIRINTNAARYMVSLPVFSLRLATLYFRLKPIVLNQAGKFTISQFNQITSDVRSSKQKWKLLNGMLDDGFIESLGGGYYRIISQQKIKAFRGRKFVQLEIDYIESLSCMDVSEMKAICLEIITTQQNAKQRKVARGYTMTNSRGQKEKVRGNRKVLEYDGLTSLEMQAKYLNCSVTEIRRLREKQKSMAVYHTEKPRLIRFSNNQYDRETMNDVFELGFKNRIENDKLKGKFFFSNNNIYFCPISTRRSLFLVKRR